MKRRPNAAAVDGSPRVLHLPSSGHLGINRGSVPRLAREGVPGPLLELMRWRRGGLKVCLRPSLNSFSCFVVNLDTRQRSIVYMAADGMPPVQGERLALSYSGRDAARRLCRTLRSPPACRGNGSLLKETRYQYATQNDRKERTLVWCRYRELMSNIDNESNPPRRKST